MKRRKRYVRIQQIYESKQKGKSKSEVCANSESYRYRREAASLGISPDHITRE
jgi:hypothetical protein